MLILIEFEQGTTFCTNQIWRQNKQLGNQAKQQRARHGLARALVLGLIIFSSLFILHDKGIIENLDTFSRYF